MSQLFRTTQLINAARLFEKSASAEKRAELRLSGLLQATKDGTLIVTVPNAIVRGVFSAMTEPGISLPEPLDGHLNAAIVVMAPEELKELGGADAITERGKQFPYRFGSISDRPAVGWPGVSKCYHLQIISPELGKLRRSYGLPTRLEGRYDFSILVACRKTGVLSAISTSKSETVRVSDGTWAGRD